MQNILASRNNLKIGLAKLTVLFCPNLIPLTEADLFPHKDLVDLFQRLARSVRVEPLFRHWLGALDSLLDHMLLTQSRGTNDAFNVARMM